MSVAKRFKGYFLHGLAVLLPSILTIWLFVWGYKFIQENISIHINRGLVLLIMRLQGDDGISKDALTKILVEGTGSVIGFLIALVGVCVMGLLLASYVGKTLWKMFERFIMNTPILKSVYPYIKQITDFFLSEQEDKKQLFSRVVAVEYPRKGIWSVGFATGSGLPNVVNNVSNIRREFLTIFIPTSPTPFTGFVITVPKKLTIELNITIEEAFRFVISGGVIVPTTVPEKTDEHTKGNLKNINAEN
ncbi:MAG: DUF502 domain-containing protein [Sedimentisphaerales bacterium]|nr:DUF502 domain-containing protein [Sedimentisphaerales bacterium]